MFKYNWCLKKKRIPPPLVKKKRTEGGMGE